MLVPTSILTESRMN